MSDVWDFDRSSSKRGEEFKIMEDGLILFPVRMFNLCVDMLIHSLLGCLGGGGGTGKMSLEEIPDFKG